MSTPLLEEQLEALAARVAELVADRQPVALLDAAQAGEQLGVPRSWVLAEARADRLPHRRLGRYVRFDPAELEAWSRAQSHGPATTRRSSAA